MNTNTAKLISPERVAQLLECYGANPQAWPEDERPTALALIQNSSELQQLQRETEQLDQFLARGAIQNTTQVADDKRVTAIVSNLPAQEGTANYTSNHDDQPSRSLFSAGNWIGMIAASVAVFVITVSIIELQPSTEPQTQASVHQPELDSWMWAQVTGEHNDEDEEPMTMMALLELEEL